jgi:Domain of unknown function (DUF427)
VVVEGNHYFPPDSVNREFLADSGTTTVCPWKGLASYDDVVVDGQANPTPRGTTRSHPTPPRRSPGTLPSGVA